MKSIKPTFQDFRLPPARRFIAPDAPGKIQILRPELTTAQFAKMINRTPSRVRQLYDQGMIKGRHLPGRTHYGRILIPVQELTPWLGDNEPA